MDKAEVIRLVREQLAGQHDRALAAVAGAREAATGVDTRAENKYDTRGLEAAYLAAGQAELVEELEWALGKLDSTSFETIENDEEIVPGALVLVEGALGQTAYLLAPAGGGIDVTTREGQAVTVLGPDSPLRHQLLGLRVGESLARPPCRVVKVS
jgi:hypothetical protein